MQDQATPTKGKKKVKFNEKNQINKRADMLTFTMMKFKEAFHDLSC